MSQYVVSKAAWPLYMKYALYLFHKNIFPPLKN